MNAGGATVWLLGRETYINTNDLHFEPDLFTPASADRLILSGLTP